ncbi:hypothetical protein FOA52_015297 [Chlamydomonas sp. UWO 241]|nr:hypothetical protein FOA52_015297 [Chlamydomonas sp. UWO 241]
MKLDVNVLRYLSKDDFRVLTAVELGQKNHEIVPLPLIDTIGGLKHGGTFKCIKQLLKHKLLHHDSSKYDGYRLTTMGYDFLAIKALCMRGHIAGIGRKIGVGKESDIYEVMNDEGEMFALKLHRLGRTSFRAVKSKRDYLGRGNHFSWLYLSRLAALKEYAFMKALGEHGFPVPDAIDHNRHAVLMTLLDARPMVQVKRLSDPATVYLTCMELISRLASKGLIHCDYNEFNLMITEEEEVICIDFPQMVSVSHENAGELFDRDVECIVRFFTKKVGYHPELDPSLPYVRPTLAGAVKELDEALDVSLAASGFKGAHQKVLERFKLESKAEDDDDDDDSSDEGDEQEERAGRVGSTGAAEEGAEGAGVSGLSLFEGGAAAGQRTGADGDGGESGRAEGKDDGEEEDDEGCSSSAGEEEEDDEDEGQQTTFGGRALSAPLAAAVASGKAAAAAKIASGKGRSRTAVAPELPSEAAVQRKVVNQAKAKAKRDAVAKAGQTRNSMKAMRKSAKASSSTSTALPSFGGW